MGRKEARETTFKLVYERTVVGDCDTLSYDLLTEEFACDDKEYIKTVYTGIVENFDYLSGLIQKYSTAFKLDRVYKIDLATLLIAAYEILFYKDIPYQISVNEAVELSKKYSTEKSYRFINGILSSIIKDMDTLKDKDALKGTEAIERTEADTNEG